MVELSRDVMMEDLQATVEIAVDLGRLCNVDLFQRGFYQVAVKLLEPSHPHAKAEVHMIKPDDSDHFCPSRVLDDGLGALSKCLQVLYKREECQLNHTFLFRVHCLLDSQKIMECLKKVNFTLEASLHFSNSDDLPDDLTECMEEVSKKTLKLELDLMYGLFANTMVLFDYGYMAAVDVTVHASLVALHQPLMTMPGVLPSSKSPHIEPSTLETILFRPLPGMSVGQADDFNVRISNAISVHAKLLKILLTVYANMQNYYITLLKSLPRKYQEVNVLSNMQQVSSRLYSREFHPDLCSLVIGPIDVTSRLSKMTSQLQKMHTLEEIVSQVNMNLASTCSLLLGLWSHVLESSCRNKHVRKQLSYNYHKSRVQRFQNAFFTTTNPRNAPFDDCRCTVYNSLASEIRSSRYFAEIPVLPIHNNEADGTSESLPIIFEDIYTHQCKKEPIFRPKSAGSIFSRSSETSGSSQGAPAERGNEYIRISEEIGTEDVGEQSSSGSISSCGEASESMDMNSKGENSTGKRRKYSGIFRKRRGSYKIRSQRFSVSDDESTKITLAEFLASIDEPQSKSTNSNKTSSTSSKESSKTKQASEVKNPKTKECHSANDMVSTKTKKRKKGPFSQHQQSFDGGAQKFMQRIGVKKRDSDETECTAKDSSKILSRSYSSSALNSSKPASSVSSRSSLEMLDDIVIRRSSDDATLRGAGYDRVQPLMSGLSITTNRRAENRFRAYLRSETSEEPESGISEKPVALSAVNPLIAPITVTTTSIPRVNIRASTSAENTMKKKSDIRHGIVKSQSYSVGIEKLQDEVENDGQFPRPHDNYTNTLPNGLHSRLKMSHTALAGLDRVRYGMGLHPGVGTVTTTDLTPFDEPEPLEAWGEISSSSPSTSLALNDAKSASMDDVSALPVENTDMQQSFDDTLVDVDATPTCLRQKDFQIAPTVNGYDYMNEKCDLNEFLKSSPPALSGHAGCIGNELNDEPGSFFFESLEDDSYIQGSTLPETSVFETARSHSLVVFTGSLNCAEEPPDVDLVNELEALGEKENRLRNAVFEPESTFRDISTDTVANDTNSSNTPTVNGRSNSIISVGKINARMSTRSKLNQLVGDINLQDVEAALFTSIDIFNAIPPLRQQRERSYVLEKKKLLSRMQFPGSLYSDIPPSIPLSPYLTQRLSMSRAFSNYSEDHHLVVCVHGLDGNSNDLRLVKTYLQLGVPPHTNLSFLMSRANQEDTYGDIDTMTERLITEIMDYIDLHFTVGRQPSRISFIGHSLGCLLIRSTIAHERMSHLKSRFHTFLSFSGPHLGTLFNNSALVSTGLWLIQKWKKSACLLQLACKDHADLRKTYVYKLSKKKGLEYFQNVLLIASAADRYVPYHSARIEMCKQAFRDKTLGPPYQEMLSNILKPVLNNRNLNFVRYHVVHSLPNTNANTVIGRAAHIAVLDSEVFLEKFFLVAGLQYFV